MEECFPRTSALPKQSPLYWVANKDRYLRQLLIRDIQESTGRDLIVYFTDVDRCTLQIDGGDDQHLIELLRGCKREGVDLLLETGGGMTDATEKVCSILRTLAPDLRVFVPRRAKSNGTVVALTGHTIVMGASSELGPIDPSFNNVPVEFVINAPPGSVNAIELQVAETFKRQTMKLAGALLSTGMMKDRPDLIDDTVRKLASRDHYHSHGSVIDAAEAISLGLNIENLPEDNELWRAIWLLRGMYAHDCGLLKIGKMFEGELVSSAVSATSPP
jgi:hypothetical protein